MVTSFQLATNPTFLKYEVLFIPKKIDLDKLLSMYPPNEIKQHKNRPYPVRDRLAWILAQIINSQYSQKSKGKKLDQGWTPISSALLQSVVHNYKQYLTYLLQIGVIECNYSYQNLDGNGTAMKYRIASKYHNHKLQRYTIFDSKLVERISKDPKSDAVKDKYDYITKWFVGLTADMAECRKRLLKRYPDSESDREYYFQLVNRNINQGRGRYSTGISNRLSTPITNIQKESRHALRYNGQRLVELDIKNSIPFMSLALLDIEIIRGSDRIRQIITSSINNTHKVDIGEQEGITNTNRVREGKGLDNYSYILVEIAEVDSNYNDIAEYRRKVVSGELYQFLADHWNKTCATSHDRNSAKKRLLSILNSPSSFACKERGELVRLFPSVLMLADKINEGYIRTNRTIGNRKWDEEIDGKKCPFAITTQKVEAWFVLERVCLRITEELPNAPIFTIHDAIYTTDNYVEGIKEILQKEFRAVLGVEGNVSTKFL